MSKRISASLLAIILGYSAVAHSREPLELTLVWHEGNLGELLIRLSKEYTRQTGVVINGELLPWDEWHEKIASAFATRSGKYDLTVFDSQSMSEFASQGHVILLNERLAKSSNIRITDFDQTASRMYAEYPEGSGNFYALPVNQDAMGLVYRKDLLEDPKEMASFQTRYGYELAAPQTYEQLRDIAEFFTRPEQNLYGIATFGSRDYDAVTSAFNNVLWSFGGDLWNSKTGKAEGVINSPASLAALQYYKKLFDYSPPGATHWFYDEVNDAIVHGKVAMAINWFYFFAAYSDPVRNPFADKMSFALLPGKKGADGQFLRYDSVGGQGISISKYSRNVEEAWEFLEWFMSAGIQWKWVRAGAQTGRVDILRSPDYKKATRYNSLFPIAMSAVKDYCHMVEYPKLLEIYQKYIHEAITGAISPKEALDQIAKEHQTILDREKPK